MIENCKTEKICSQISVGLEPPAGDVNSIADCQEWGRAVQSLGADFFYFSGVTEMAECQMFASIQSSCSAIGGPAAAPPMEECEGGLKGPEDKTSKSCHCQEGGQTNLGKTRISKYPFLARQM